MPAQAVITQIGMPLAEFLQRQDNAQFEIIEGEVIEVAPSVFGSGEVARLLLEALYAYNITTHSIRVYSDTTFVLPDADDETWVRGSRIPDVMGYQRERLESYQANTPDWRVKPLLLVPDFVAEIVSPTDKLPKVWRKASVYLEDGVRLIWVINPMRQIVTVFAAGEAPITLERSAILDGSEVLPNFNLAIHELF